MTMRYRWPTVPICQGLRHLLGPRTFSAKAGTVLGKSAWLVSLGGQNWTVLPESCPGAGLGLFPAGQAGRACDHSLSVEHPFLKSQVGGDQILGFHRQDV